MIIIMYRGSELKTVGVAMRNARERDCFTPRNSEMREGKRLENGASETADTESLIS